MPYILLFIRIEKQFVCELFCEIVALIVIFLTENTYKVLIHALSSFIFCISAVHVKLQFPIFIQKVEYNSNHQQQHSFSMQYISFHAVI